VIGLDVFARKKSVELERATVERFDLVLIATNHSCANYQELADWAHCIVDMRNAMSVTRTIWQSLESIDISCGQKGCLASYS
jgi:UDP-N-acetyl-D-mannosaminuronate dehydrogenase